MLTTRKTAVYAVVFIALLFLYLEFFGPHQQSRPYFTGGEPKLYRPPPSPQTNNGAFNWATLEQHHPVTSYHPLPTAGSTALPRIQHVFQAPDSTSAKVRQDRAKKVKQTLERCWSAYRERAWLADELTPISGSKKTTFGGWAATLVDSLDTLWIMDMKTEFWEGVNATLAIDFSDSSMDLINIFETTIRYLGGFLAAYDLSGDQRLLDKSVELAEMIYHAFDTPNRMPITRWRVHDAAEGLMQTAPNQILSAEIGSLELELTRLSQITNDPRWHDAGKRVMDVFDEQQSRSNLPGMWPLAVNAFESDFSSGTTFTLGAMADSLYEYLPKMYSLLGGSEQYKKMYVDSMDAAIKHALYRPMLPDGADVLMSGPVHADSPAEATTMPEGQHLVCFAGGMFAMGGKLHNLPEHVEIGRKLTDGCIWTYHNSALGIMPETFATVACKDKTKCEWDEAQWEAEVLARADLPEGSAATGKEVAERRRLPKGFTAMNDRRYVLRPEAIESVFYLYRITGDADLLEAAWTMFEATEKHTHTAIANAAIVDMSDPAAPKSDSMESFWTAETLKYYYLTFSEPELISLDEWVLNTEAHPFKRPAGGGG
ncbi:hypothetical protein MBLNU230_g8050t1 [Neophaeotheca triangularis]